MTAGPIAPAAGVPPRVLIVKLSSLGDVVHAMPAVQDVRAAWPDATIDWVVEPAFAPLVQRCAGVNRTIAFALRRWRARPWSSSTRSQWRGFRHTLQQQPYDLVLDLQGLTKSALVAWLARLAPGGRRVALGVRTDGSSWERPTRWVADLAVDMPRHVHAVHRSRLLVAAVTGCPVPERLVYGLESAVDAAREARKTIAFVHGSSRHDKDWPLAHWVALGQRLAASGWRIALPQASDAEQARAQAIARAIVQSQVLGASDAVPAAVVWPRMDLAQVLARLAGCAGVVGVDSGLSHMAVALGLPHVQIYNHDTAWRTGPQGAAHQCSVFQRPTPTVDAVHHAWQRCCEAAVQARS